MKALIMYFSQTGNTEKIAKGIYEVVSADLDTECKKLEDVQPDEVVNYDVIFLGAPLHSGDLAVPMKDFLSAMKGREGQQLAAFITHFSPAYPEQKMDQFTKTIQNACDTNGIDYRGSFDCQGYLVDRLHDHVKGMLKLDDEQWAGMVKQMTGKPNEEDVANAKSFAKSLLG